MLSYAAWASRTDHSCRRCGGHRIYVFTARLVSLPRAQDAADPGSFVCPVLSCPISWSLRYGLSQGASPPTSPLRGSVRPGRADWETSAEAVRGAAACLGIRALLREAKSSPEPPPGVFPLACGLPGPALTFGLCGSAWLQHYSTQLEPKYQNLTIVGSPHAAHASRSFRDWGKAAGLPRAGLQALAYPDNVYLAEYRRCHPLLPLLYRFPVPFFGSYKLQRDPVRGILSVHDQLVL